VPDIGNLVRRVLLSGFLLLGWLSQSASAEDSYLLALTWQPGFCADATHAAFAECKIAAKDKPRLVLHGLWPDWDVNGDGKRNADDDFCILNRKEIMALDSGNWLKLPPVQLSEASTSDLEGAMPGITAGLERHEWWKHGTCSELTAEDYFATAIVLMRQVERGRLAHLLVTQAGGKLERRKLLEAFALDFGTDATRALVLDCTKRGGDTALTEIRLRLKRSGIAQGLTAESLSVPAKPARGDCAAEVLIPAWPH
jgi:ribonuclease T2